MIDRLRHRDEFRRLRRDGRRRRHELLWCSSLHDPAINPARVAFALPRTVGNAVLRNRIRRRLRAILRAEEVPAGLWLFGLDRRPGSGPAVDELTFDQLRTMLRTLIAVASTSIDGAAAPAGHRRRR